MAEDDGTGRPVYPAPSTTDSGGGSGNGGSKDLDVDASELIKFKNKVDGLLTKLEKSPAGPKSVAGGKVLAGDLGTGFSEVTDLYGTYQSVHRELKNLSKGLAGQIEALGIAIDGSRKGYENIDDDIKRRMQRISNEARIEYDRRQEELRKAQGQPTDEKSGESGSDAGGTS